VSLLAVGQRHADRADLAARRHSGTSVTELVNRKQIQPVVDHDATVMDQHLPTQET